MNRIRKTFNYTGEIKSKSILLSVFYLMLVLILPFHGTIAQVTKNVASQIINTGSGTFIQAPAGGTIKKINPTNNSYTSFRLSKSSDSTYGIKIGYADAYLCEVSVNNNYLYTDVSNLIDYPAFTGGAEVFQQGLSHIFQVTEHNYVSCRYNQYLMVNIPPLDTNNLSPFADKIFNLIDGYNDSVDGLFWYMPPYAGKYTYTKAMILVVQNLDSNNKPVCLGTGLIFPMSDREIYPIGELLDTPVGCYSEVGSSHYKGVFFGHYKVIEGGQLQSIKTPFEVFSLYTDPADKKSCLYQNFPNPFNPSTYITYKIINACNVQIKIYDVLGREVAVLVNEFKQAGSYYAKFNASKLASGIYFCFLKAGDYVEAKKMLFIK